MTDLDFPRETYGRRSGSPVTRAVSSVLGPMPPRLASWLLALIPRGWGQTSLAMPASWRLHQRCLRQDPEHRLRKARLWGGARLELDLSDRIQAGTFLTRRYQPPITTYLVRQMAQGGVFLDVGANIGAVSFVVASRCRRAGVFVHSFEPDPANAEAFRRNQRLNPDLDVTLNEVAVGAAAGTASFVPGPAGEAFLGKITDRPRVSESQRPRVNVRLIALDDYLGEREIDRVRALKLDVEGYEPEALVGLERALSEHRVEAIVCEVDDHFLDEQGWSRDRLFGLMEGHGYVHRRLPLLGLGRLRPRDSRSHEDFIFFPDRP
jgi:FkbM family methyltransferase